MSSRCTNAEGKSVVMLLAATAAPPSDTVALSIELRRSVVDLGKRLLRAQGDTLGGLKTNMAGGFVSLHRIIVVLKLGEDFLARIGNRRWSPLALPQPLSKDFFRRRTFKDAILRANFVGQGLHMLALGSFGERRIEND